MDDVMETLNNRKEDVDIQNVLIQNMEIDQDAYDSLINDSKVFDLFLNIEGILADNREESSNKEFS
jgi:hypothetical protein